MARRAGEFTMTHLFCFGLGYSARIVAERLSARGFATSGTSTTDEGAAALSKSGAAGYVFNGNSPNAQITAALAHASHVLLSVPPGADGDPVFVHHGANIAASPSITWIGYFSTVGVYGDAGGGWVDEETEPRPASERGRRRLAAERRWLELGAKTGKCVMVFRLPGIYGPGRSVLDDLEAGTARRIVKPGQVFNRIHVDDIAAAVVAGIDAPHPGRVFNVTDDEPCPPQDVVAFASRLLGIEPPPEIEFETAPLSSMARSFYSESKRVSNARMKSELRVRLAFPTYRQGIETLLRNRR